MISQHAECWCHSIIPAYRILSWPRVWLDTCWFYRAHWHSLRWLRLSWWKRSPLRWEELLEWACLIQAGSVQLLYWYVQLLVVWWASQWHCSYPGAPVCPGGLWALGDCQLSAFSCGLHLGVIWECRQDRRVPWWLFPSWAQHSRGKVAGSRAGSSRSREGAWPAALQWALSQLAEPQPAQVQLQETHVYITQTLHSGLTGNAYHI